MLNIDDATRAIQYFFKDVENLQIGNPLPFCETYNATTSGATSFKEFNKLIIPSVKVGVVGIFYGDITYSKEEGSCIFQTQISKKLDFSNPYASISIHQSSSSSLSSGFNSNGVLIQQLAFSNTGIIAMNGYLFALKIVTP